MLWLLIPQMTAEALFSVFRKNPVFRLILIKVIHLGSYLLINLDNFTAQISRVQLADN